MFGSATTHVSLDNGATWTPLTANVLAKNKAGAVVPLDDVIDQNDYEVYAEAGR